MGKKQLTKTEQEKKLREAGAAAGADEKPAPAANDKGDAGHDDAEQDKALIGKMLDEYAGKAEEMDSKEREAMEGLATEAYQAHKEMGKNPEEAYKHAGEAIKLAKHMASKKESKEAECSDEEKVKKEAEAKEAAEKEALEKKESEAKEGEAKKESEKIKDLTQKLLEANGKIAALNADLNKGNVEKYVEGKLRTSGQTHSITKAFREAAGEITSTKDFDTKWSIFSEGLKRTDPVELDFSIFTEKAVITESGEAAGAEGGLDFSEVIK